MTRIYQIWYHIPDVALCFQVFKNNTKIISKQTQRYTSFWICGWQRSYERNIKVLEEADGHVLVFQFCKNFLGLNASIIHYARILIWVGDKDFCFCPRNLKDCCKHGWKKGSLQSLQPPPPLPSDSAFDALYQIYPRVMECRTSPPKNYYWF